MAKNTGFQFPTIIVPCKMLTEQLYSAYLGELYGIAFFTAFAEKYSDDKHINKWLKLILVEQVTAGHLENGLEKLGIFCPDNQ